MGRGFWGGLVEDLAHLGGLVFRPFADGGAAAYGGVLGLDFGGAAAREEGPNVGLEAAEGDKVAVCLCCGVLSQYIILRWV